MAQCTLCNRREQPLFAAGQQLICIVCAQGIGQVLWGSMEQVGAIWRVGVAFAKTLSTFSTDEVAERWFGEKSNPRHGHAHGELAVEYLQGGMVDDALAEVAVTLRTRDGTDGWVSALVVATASEALRMDGLPRLQQALAALERRST